MSDTTAIEWCDSTFNPWEGCQKVGPGCDNCYAENRNARFGGGVAVNWGPGAPRRRTSTSNWAKPLQWERAAAAFMAAHGRRRRVFCASLADWLDNEVPIEWLVDLLALIRLTPHLDWLLLSKRIGNWRGRVAEALSHCAWSSDSTAFSAWVEAWLRGTPPPNVWLGATVVNQAEADRDIPKLLAVPARVRFLSIEPMLGPIDLQTSCTAHCPNRTCYPLRGHPNERCVVDSYEGGIVVECICSRLNGIDWVICGGESGPKARPMHPDWARSLRDQCAAAGVPFLFKQWGEWGPDWEGAETCQACSRTKFDAINSHGECGHCGIDAWMPTDKPLDKLRRVGKKAAGRLLDGRTHDGFPEPRA